MLGNDNGRPDGLSAEGGGGGGGTGSLVRGEKLVAVNVDVLPVDKES